MPAEPGLAATTTPSAGGPVTGPADPAGVLDRVWRADHAGMLGVFARRLSDLARAEDALQ